MIMQVTADVPEQWNCEFTVAPKVCLNQHVKVIYTGGASANATYLWNFDGAVVISGSGQGPYYVKWETNGEKHITLSINWEGITCTLTKPVVVVVQPAQFNMTGGGVLVPGGPGVEVGLSGSETGVFYKLRKDGAYTGAVANGTGLPLSFGLQTSPGSYTAVAKIDGSDCMTEMLGTAVITGSMLNPVLCMVTFDTAFQHNKVIWNKPAGPGPEVVNIYRETYQNNVYSKIGEALWTGPNHFYDTLVNPLVKSDKYKISFTYTGGHESEKTLPHKTVHLNINPGIMGFNLIWNHYEGFEFKTYRIHRKLQNTGWEVIDSVAGNVDSYTDFYTASGLTTYYIEVLRQEPCFSIGKSGEADKVMSNRAAAVPLGVESDATTGILIYPNPVREKLVVAMARQGTYKMEIYRLDGVLLRSEPLGDLRNVIGFEAMSPGVYFIRISGENSVMTKKIVKP